MPAARMMTIVLAPSRVRPFPDIATAATTLDGFER